MSRFTSYVHLYTVIVNVEKALINYKGELTVTFFYSWPTPGEPHEPKPEFVSFMAAVQAALNAYGCLSHIPIPNHMLYGIAYTKG